MVGKDILRFHAVYWPAFLMAADLTPPKRVFAHGWWTNEGQKISKSLGNVIDPKDLVERYGLDPVRYFMLREVPFGQDGDFSHRAMVGRINGDLANDFGNLAQRVLSMIGRYCGGPAADPPAASPKPIARFSTRHAALLPQLRAHLDKQEMHVALVEMWEVIAQANGYVARQAPWTLRKTDPARMQTVLFVAAETLRRLAILAQPFMPQAGALLLDQLCIPADRRSFAALSADHAASAGHRLAAAGRGLPALRRRAAARTERHAGRQPLPSRSRQVRRRTRAGDRAGARRRRLHHADHLPRRLPVFRRCWRSPSGTRDVFCTVGVHPHHAAEEAAVTTEQLVRLARHPKVVGIGECGLDYFYKRSPQDVQIAVFRTHIAAARETGLPLVVHTRDADADMAAILAEEQQRGRFGGVLHCFSSGPELAEAAVRLGFLISFSGILTFKNSEPLRAIATGLPSESLLVETDAPYLAPEPKRGKRNEPGLVRPYAVGIGDLPRHLGRGADGRDNRQLLSAVRQGCQSSRRPIRGNGLDDLCLSPRRFHSPIIYHNISYAVIGWMPLGQGCF